jgi:hypothetical protein
VFWWPFGKKEPDIRSLKYSSALISFANSQIRSLQNKWLFASEGVRRNVLARIAAGGPGFGPNGFSESAHFLLGRVRCPCEGPDSQNDRQFVTAWNDDRLGNQRIVFNRVGQIIQRCLQKRPGFEVANEKTFVFDLNIIVENRVRRSVYVDDKDSGCIALVPRSLPREPALQKPLPNDALRRSVG